MGTPEPEYEWPAEPSWYQSVKSGSWLRVLSLEQLEKFESRVHPRWRPTAELRAIHSARVQVNRKSSYHGNVGLITVFGALGHFLPAYFELEQREPDPIDYDWSGKLATKTTNGSNTRN
jgi:hypothetical protein